MCLFNMCSRVVFFCEFHVCPISFCDVFLCRWHVLSPLCALPLFVGEIPKCKKTNENEKQITFNCVSLLVCSHAFLMCFRFVVCWCVFSICVRAWRFICDFHVCPISFRDVYLCRWHVLSPLCALPLFVGDIRNVRQPMKMKYKSLSIAFPFWCVFMPFRCVVSFVVCSCVFSICVHVWCFSVIFMCVQFLFATSICADGMCSRLFALFLLTWEKSPNVRKPMKMKYKSPSIAFPSWCVFMPFWCVFPLLCVHVSFRYVFGKVFSVIFMRVQFLFATSICADDMCSRLFALCLCLWETSENVRQPMKMKYKSLSIAFPFWCVFMPFRCVVYFVVCSCVFSICVHVWCFSVIFMCVSNFFLRRLFVQMTCVLASLRFSSERGRNPQCKTTNENERQITFNCVSLLVCFHAFLMCFPFVVCSCVFSICVRV